MTQRFQAGRRFVQLFLAKNGGPLQSEHWKPLKKGWTPGGWFAEFCKAHPKLLRIGHKRKHVAILKMNQRSVKLYLSNTSFVAEECPVEDDTTDENPNA